MCLQEVLRGVRISELPYCAKPYFMAMLSMDSVDDQYGCDSGREIVLRFLCNAGTWRGETARRVKKQLKELLK